MIAEDNTEQEPEVINATSLVKRGWPRPWAERFLGDPKFGPRNAKIWLLSDVLIAENDPIFTNALMILKELLLEAPYETKELQNEAIDLALSGYKPGDFKDNVISTKRPPYVPRAKYEGSDVFTEKQQHIGNNHNLPGNQDCGSRRATEVPQQRRNPHLEVIDVDGGKELRFADGLRASIPNPFLTAAQISEAVSADDFRVVVTMVASDINNGGWKFNNPPHARNFFLSCVRSNIKKLRSLREGGGE